MIQLQKAGVAVLGGEFHLSVQSFQNGVHLVGVAGQRDRLSVGLGVHTHIVLPDHIHQEVVPPVAVEVLRGDAAGVIVDRELRSDLSRIFSPCGAFSTVSSIMR